ncbi:MAG: cyclic nucleotide-binding domain-containing protein, partial [Lachnospiraceae bacterium]|nr:cyclic nucleotide-binding domain-containing protein [Lachnospiraceae bacterium]
MEKQTFKADDTIHVSGHPLDSLQLILEGTVSAAYDGGEILLSKGDCLGLAGVFSNTHLMTVRAVTQVTVASYAYDGEFMQFLGKLPPEVKGYFASSISRQIRELLSKYKMKKSDSMYSYNFYTHSYARYAKMCENHSMSPRTLPGQEDIAPLLIEEDIDPWLGGYYDCIIELLTNTPYPARISLEFYCGLIMVMSRSISRLIILINLVHEYSQNIMRFFINEEHLDFFEMFTAAYFRIYHLADKEKPDPALIDD